MPLPFVALWMSGMFRSATTTFGVCCRRFMFGRRSVPPAKSIASPGAWSARIDAASATVFGAR
jgi:hypothetical protein